jgi:hypothetical protein
MADRLAVVLCEARNAGPGQRRLERELADALSARPDVELAALPHLYDLAPGGPGLKYLQSLPGNFIVLAWLPARAAYWVLRAHGIPSDRSVWCLDLAGHATAATVLAELAQVAGETGRQVAAARSQGPHQDEARPARIDEPLGPRWYPVIDQDRCKNCLECLNFCLFGVFGLDDEGQLFVEQPDACRDGCPACSRICPAGAILFPEYPDPAIAGREALPGDKSAQPQDDRGERGAGSMEQGEKSTPARDDLDHLVDELDRSDL